MQRDATAPRKIGEFQPNERIGSGGSSDVYAAVHLPTGEPVALKLLHASLTGSVEHREAFRREADLAASAAHPGVVRVIGSGEAADPEDPARTRAWIAFERVPGRTLSSEVRRRGPLDAADARTLATAVLDALQHAHAQGVVHRDLTPANVMLAREPDGRFEGGTVRLIDFGLAAPPGARAVGTGPLPAGDSRGRRRRLGGGDDGVEESGVLGNPLYISPEQAQGLPVFETADLYQLGGLLHFALTGAPPFVRDEPLATMTAHVSDPPTPPSRLVPGLPAELDRLVLRALRKDPAARFSSAAEMLRAVRAAIGPSAAGSLGDGVAETADPDGDGEPEEAVTDRLPLLRPASNTPERRERSARRVARPRPGRGSRRTSWLLGIAGLVIFAAALGLAIVATLQASSPPGINASSTRPKPSQEPERPEPTATRPIDAPTTPAPTRPEPTRAPSAPRATVPELVGLSLKQATALLTAHGLTLGPVTTSHGAAAQDTVLSSTEPSGRKLAEGSAVGLTIASGWNTVPTVRGLSGYEARAALQRAGFLVEAVEQREEDDPGSDPGVDPGTPATPPNWTAQVVGSSPEAGTAAALGSTVTLTLSRSSGTPGPSPTPPTTPAALVQRLAPGVAKSTPDSRPLFTFPT